MSNFLLEKLGFKNKTHVSISVSVNNFIELVCIDERTKAVVRYASGNIKYNTAIKEIMDLTEFQEVVEGLFEDAGLSPFDCSVTLNLPNVYFAISNIDNSMDKNSSEDLILDDLEDLYIFKKNEPVISSVTLSNPSEKTLKIVVSGAIQSKVVSSMIDIFDSVGAELVRIDTSYSSLFKALTYCERFNKLITKDNTSVIILVTTISCTSFYMKGQTIAEVVEEPLAVKSFSPEEVYAVVSKITANAVSKNNPQNLLIISEAEEIDAEGLAGSINFKGELDYFNKNIKRSDDFIDIDPTQDIDVNLATYLTLEAVGAAVSDYEDFPVDLNFMPSGRIQKNIIKIGDLEGDWRPFAVACIIIAVLCAGVLYGITNAIVSTQITAMNNEKGELDKSINIFKTNTSKKDDKQESIFPILQTISTNNKSVIDVYNALSTTIPDDIYIKRFVANPQGGIGILGESRSSESVNDFIKGLKEKNDSLMVSKLSLNDPAINPNVTIPNGVTFEIKTSTIDVQFIGNLIDYQSFGNNSQTQTQTPGQPPVI